MKVFIILATLLASTSVLAAGFEKATLWSAKWSSLAGSASAGVDGADAIYFNPAGLVNGSEYELSFNISPTFAQFKGVFDTATSTQDVGETNLSPVFGIAGKYKLNDKWSLGIGFYTSAGAKASYDEITYNGFTNAKPKAEADLKVIELALGAGYKHSDDLSFGFEWRATTVAATYRTVSPATAAAVVGGDFTNLKANDYGGFKLGAQYKASEDIALGFAYRSAVNFKAKGDYSLTQYTASGAGAAGGAGTGETEISNSLPDQLSVDVIYKMSPVWDMYAGYTFTKYSVNKEFEVEGLPNIPQNWKDQNNVRLAFEYNGVEGTPIRFGYVYTTQVTADNNASPTYTPGDIGHTLTFGAGRSLYEKYIFDVGLEYNAAKATGATSYPSPVDTTSTATGDFEAAAYAIHASVKMPF